MLRIALLAAALTPAAVSAQVIEITTDRSWVDLSVPGGNVVNVSVTIDRQGYAEGPWANFHGWTAFSIVLVANGGQYQLPVEHDTDINSGAWEGRRPPTIAGQGGGNNGGFRFEPYGDDDYFEGPGTENWHLGTVSPDQVRPWDTVLGRTYPIDEDIKNSADGMQGGNALSGFNQNQAERIEIFRARMVFDTPGIHEVSVIPVDCAFWDSPELLDAVLGLEEVLSVMSIQIATVEARIPTPATLTLLGAIPLMRRRR